MHVLDLFSGIGGFSLGLERAGMRTVAFCEIDPFARAVLAKHWPQVPCYDDVQTLTRDRLCADGVVRPDVICGGFPCQDISGAGKGAGLAGERSGLWSEFARLIGEIRPRYAIIENVALLRSRGLDQVLGTLDALGYDAEWHCIPASAIGAPHYRDRVWIVAYANDTGCRDASEVHAWRGQHGEGQRVDAAASGCGVADVGHADRPGCDWLGVERRRQGREAVQTERASEALAHAQHCRCKGRCAFVNGIESAVSIVPRDSVAGPLITSADIRRSAAQRGWGRSEPGLGRAADGLPARLDRTRPVEAWEGNTPRTVGRGAPNRRPRLKALGNSVVPQIVELIGHAIMRAEREPCA